MVCITDCACVQGKNPYLPGVSCPPGDSSCTACWLTKGGSTRCNPTSNEISSYGHTCPYNGQATGVGHSNVPPPASHCQHVIDPSSPYVGHCVGERCGNTGAGSIMSNGLCSISNVPSGGGGGGTGTANDVIFDVVQTLRAQLGAQFVNDNETCIRNYLQAGYPSILRSMTTVPFKGSVYAGYRTKLLDAFKANTICASDGGGKAPGTQACHGGQSNFFGPVTDIFGPVLGMVGGPTQTGGSGQPMLCPGGPGGGGGAPGDTGDFCQKSFGLNCPQLGLIGTIAVFGIFILVIIKR